MSKKKTAAMCVLFIALSTIITLPVCSAQVPGDAIAFNGNAYKAFSSSVMKRTAASECRRLGGHLLMVDSHDEQTFILNHFPAGEYWLGMEKQSDGSWRWDDGYSAGNVSFAFQSESDDGAVISVPDGGWKTTGVNESHLFICEWEDGASELEKNNTTEKAERQTKIETVIQVVTEIVTAQPTTQAPKPSTTKPIPTVDMGKAPTEVTAIPEALSEIVESGADALQGISIADTVYVYENTFYYQIAEDDSVVISYYVGTNSNVTIPSKIDGKPVKYIAKRSFQSMTLSSVVIPPEVMLIDDSAFCNVSPDFQISGKKGTVAEFFAKKNKIKFAEAVFDGKESNGAGEEVSADNGATDKRERILKSKLKAVIGMLAVCAAVIVVFIIFAIRRNRFYNAIDADRRRMAGSEDFHEGPPPLPPQPPKSQNKEKIEIFDGKDEKDKDE